MRKLTIGITAFAAALTLTSGITAFAGEWKSDAVGTYYEDDNGHRPVYGGWFTEPETGTLYAMDMDGYLMRNSQMGSYRTDDNGARMEPTEEDLKRAAEREAELLKRPSPSKENAQANAAATTAKTSTAATGTTRTVYTAEMEAFMEKIMTAAQKARTNTDIKYSKTKSASSLAYAFSNPDGYSFLRASTWKVKKSTTADYQEYAYDMTYHFDSAVADTGNYDDAYRQLVIAAVGDVQGQALLDHVNAQRTDGSESFDQTGTTDAGNSYSVKYRSNVLTLTVVCSEAVADDTTAEEAAVESDNTDETVETETSAE